MNVSTTMIRPHARSGPPAARSRIRSTACLILLATWLSGCMQAPGMRMRNPPSLLLAPARSPDAGAAAELSLKIEEISLSLVDGPQRRRAFGPEPSIAPPRAPDIYTVGGGDVLQVTVWDHPELVRAVATPGSSLPRPADAPPGFVVDQDGTLRFPYAGRLHVEGMSVVEIQALLTRHLARFFRDPQVTVRIASFRAKRVQIDGEVREPGSLSVNDVPMSALDAVARAGGFSPSADLSRIVHVREGREIRLDLSPDSRDPQARDLVMSHGDRLVVPSREQSGAYVMGEVGTPGVAVPDRNGRLSLSEAIAQAGSLNPSTADAAQVYVIRAIRHGGWRVYRLDATTPVAMMLANRFEIEPHDIVYVDGGGLVRLNRILSLLMPAINSGLTAGIVAK